MVPLSWLPPTMRIRSMAIPENGAMPILVSRFRVALVQKSALRTRGWN